MLYVSWYRCARDRLAHAITDEDFARGVHAQQGRYVAVCDHELLIDSCMAPLSRVCDTCRALVAAHNRSSSRLARVVRPRRSLRWWPAAFRRTAATKQ